MKSYDSRTYSINDFVEWDSTGSLELNAAFQRRSVWNDKAKSYLMDTIIRGKPIPKVFVRQKINVMTKKSIREIVDGQQRMRTILSFVKDGFVISRAQNKEFGGKKFSQLPEDVREQLLSYEISVDLLINLPNDEILDIFSRLNSYAIILNPQEKINANHFGPFKILADNLGRKYAEYWEKQKVLTANNVLRMYDANLAADLLIAMLEGIKSSKQIKKYYDQYEQAFLDEAAIAALSLCFDQVVERIAKLFPEGISGTEFRRTNLYYSLFTAVSHCMFGLPNMQEPRPSLEGEAAMETARNGLDRVGELFQAEDPKALAPAETQFLLDYRRASTDELVRVRRTKYLLTLMA